MSDEDRCRCGHHRAHHVTTCKAMRPVGIGSTPPGFQQRTERCPCLGFTLWQTAEKDAGISAVGALLLGLIAIPLLLLAFIVGGQDVICGHGGEQSYCETAR